jgi:hypothetical protein
MARKRDLDVHDVENACIPLTSVDPAANVYHQDLIGVNPNTVLTRDGYGRGFALDGQINTQNTGGATWTLTRSVSFTKSTMIGVSYSDGTTNTKVNGTSWSEQSSSSIQQSISKLLEKSNSTVLVNDQSSTVATIYKVPWENLMTRVLVILRHLQMKPALQIQSHGMIPLVRVLARILVPILVKRLGQIQQLGGINPKSIQRVPRYLLRKVLLVRLQSQELLQTQTIMAG